ncbi:4-hydroxy-4-methyl-2-oxoglutarate aldolase [Kribbella orskensis]|uniref:Putative 4-hydroxy-4-methyl-2-oxoglutarate aldolase n=1 Tax=Kribbella orskensis TaxID=2512216 RepID=A0ABY2BA87_9ACTN|nr:MULTISPECIES: 4-carboxy-4-hydroxy-2-oxoadipate aldolase/oxaloacetate decarboxylase [Kribbella]TCN32272.1 4-hydroxy-4-methyl-2-oxoglutarate aldolase [Kribbella sp. VKM Ac-2500]TCO12633.1 4-hydroxy-4-methyl-2-oxoglutarate aldolase [Kribbella orskensis]
MSARVIRRIERPAPELVKAAASYGVATLHEAAQRRGLMVDIHPVVPGLHACGPAVTSLNHPGDNLMLHAAVEVCEPGDVLVVATMSRSTDGMFGELLATQCRAQEIAGVILDAGARDRRDLIEMKFPVWSRAISAAGTVKATPGWVNVPVVCGGATVTPGDLVVADDDGVTVIPRAEVAAVVEAARLREEKEARNRVRLQAGELSLDVNNLRPLLERLGVTYES